MKDPDYQNLEAFSKVAPEDLHVWCRSKLGDQTVGGAGSTKAIAMGEVVLARLVAVRDRVADQLIERDELANMVIASLVSGVPMVVLGPPGTGKSQTVRLISESCLGLPAKKEGSGRVSRTFFDYLLTSHTMPEELFGPPDLDALHRGEFRRRTDRMLPEAEFAFLDEVFRGSTHIMNTLLTIINERMFHDGAELRRIPLLGVVSASNRAPSDPEAEAFFDRFPIRYWVDSVLGSRRSTEGEFDGALSGLLNKSANHERDQRLQVSSQGEELACTNDFRLAAAVLSSQRFWIPQQGKETDRFRQFAQAVRRLKSELQISDRGVASLWRFGVTLDWLRGNSIMDDSDGHLDALLHTAGTPERASMAKRIVDTVRDDEHPHTAS